MYRNIKSLRCAPGTNMVLEVKYTLKTKDYESGNSNMTSVTYTYIFILSARSLKNNTSP